MYPNRHRIFVSNTMSSEVTVEIATSATDLLRVAETELLAFHGGNLNTWFRSPYASVDPITEPKLKHSARGQKRRLDSPRRVLVVAKIDGVIVGHAHWDVPRRMWREETLLGKATTYGISWADWVADRIWPAWWESTEVKKKRIHLNVN